VQEEGFAGKELPRNGSRGKEKRGGTTLAVKRGATHLRGFLDSKAAANPKPPGGRHSWTPITGREDGLEVFFPRDRWGE